MRSIPASGGRAKIARLPSGNTVCLSPGAIRAGKEISGRFRAALPNLPETNAETLAMVIELETHSFALLETLKLLLEDSKEFHDEPDAEELRSGSHTECGWCLARKVIAKAEGAQ